MKVCYNPGRGAIGLEIVGHLRIESSKSTLKDTRHYIRENVILIDFFIEIFFDFRRIPTLRET